MATAPDGLHRATNRFETLLRGSNKRPNLPYLPDSRDLGVESPFQTIFKGGLQDSEADYRPAILSVPTRMDIRTLYDGDEIDIDNSDDEDALSRAFSSILSRMNGHRRPPAAAAEQAHRQAQHSYAQQSHAQHGHPQHGHGEHMHAQQGYEQHGHAQQSYEEQSYEQTRHAQHSHAQQHAAPHHRQQQHTRDEHHARSPPTEKRGASPKRGHGAARGPSGGRAAAGHPSYNGSQAQSYTSNNGSHAHSEASQPQHMQAPAGSLPGRAQGNGEVGAGGERWATWTAARSGGPSGPRQAFAQYPSAGYEVEEEDERVLLSSFRALQQSIRTSMSLPNGAPPLAQASHLLSSSPGASPARAGGKGGRPGGMRGGGMVVGGMRGGGGMEHGVQEEGSLDGALSLAAGAMRNQIARAYNYDLEERIGPPPADAAPPTAHSNGAFTSFAASSGSHHAQQGGAVRIPTGGGNPREAVLSSGPSRHVEAAWGARGSEAFAGDEDAWVYASRAIRDQMASEIETEPMRRPDFDALRRRLQQEGAAPADYNFPGTAGTAPPHETQQ
ncbi:hypothetical protein T484DRAFT_1883736, partial [Baffinella frigidus]